MLDSGALKIGSTVKIAYVDQNRAGIDPNKSVWEVVSSGLDFIQVGNIEIPSRAYVASFGFKGQDQQKRQAHYREVKEEGSTLHSR